MDVLTEEQFKDALPPKMKRAVNPSLIVAINNTLSAPEEYENFRDNLIGYASVMKDGRFKLTSYIQAVRYCSYKFMGCTNIEAYSRAFPEKIKKFHAQGVSPKDIASYNTAYNKSKLVSLIMGQSLTPTWILNQDKFQEAINVQADLMLNANSEKVRSDAANSLLTHLKQPETAKIALDVVVTEDSAVAALQRATLAHVAHLQQSLRAGITDMKEVAATAVFIDKAEEP